MTCPPGLLHERSDRDGSSVENRDEEFLLSRPSSTRLFPSLWPWCSASQPARTMTSMAS